MNQSGLTNVNLPNCKNIDYTAFAHCEHLQNVNIPNVENILRLNRVYQTTNLVGQDNFFPIISDGVITLSWRHRKCDNIDFSDEAYLDIIVNEKRKVLTIYSYVR